MTFKITSMKKLILIILLLLNFSGAISQENAIEQDKIKEDLNQIIEDLSMDYTYLDEKGVDINCVKPQWAQMDCSPVNFINK